MLSARKIAVVTALLVAWFAGLDDRAIPLVPRLGGAATRTTSKGTNVPGKVLGACAAFAANGASAAATFDTANLLLDFTSDSGKHWRLSLLLQTKEQISIKSQYPGAANSCDAYFDRANDLVAVGIDQLRIAVADVKRMKWVGDWEVKADIGIASPSLAGFLAGTTALVVGGEPPAEQNRGIHWGLYATALFSPSGKQLSPLHLQRYAPDGHIFRRFADASHDQLWVFRCEPVDAPMSRQPLCPIVSTSLTGSQESHSEFTPSMQGTKRTDLWFYPDTLAAPDPSLIAFGEGVRVWTVDLRGQTLCRLTLPRRPHYPNFEQIDGRVALAPDGQVMAVAVDRSRLAFPFLVDNYVFQGTDIAVIQTNPLRFIGALRYGRAGYAPAFAVDHRRGRTTVLMYRHNRWDRQEISNSAHP